MSRESIEVLFLFALNDTLPRAKVHGKVFGEVAEWLDKNPTKCYNTYVRIKLTNEKRLRLFNILEERGLDCASLGNRTGVCERTVRDWASGKYLLTEKAFKIFLRISGLKDADLCPQILSDHWHISCAAEKGGRKRYELYGPFGTPESRKKGGLRSAQKQCALPNGFQKLKPIYTPRRSAELAEFLGIMQGDGHLATYQVLIATNSETDVKHARFVGRLGKKLFGIAPRISTRKDEKTIRVVFSSKNMVASLKKFGMPIGNKLDHGLSIPKWIAASTKYKKAFIRGLFDTDGCLFLDKHRTKHKLYEHIGWMITSVSPHFREQIVQTMYELGFRPSCQPSQISVFLRRQVDIRRFFDEVGSSNKKHLDRYHSFQQRIRRGA